MPPSPRTVVVDRRVQTIRTLVAAGVPVTALVAPVIPQLNDSDLEAVLEASAGAGVRARASPRAPVSLQFSTSQLGLFD